MGMPTNLNEALADIVKTAALMTEAYNKLSVEYQKLQKEKEAENK